MSESYNGWTHEEILRKLSDVINEMDGNGKYGTGDELLEIIVALKAEWKYIDKDEAMFSVYHLLEKTVTRDYATNIAESIIDDVVEDLSESADITDWNDDDVRYAIGRVLCKKLGIGC